MQWNYLSIPKLQRLHRWSLGRDKKFHPTLYQVCEYLSMLGLKLIHVSKRGQWSYASSLQDLGTSEGESYHLLWLWLQNKQVPFTYVMVSWTLIPPVLMFGWCMKNDSVWLTVHRLQPGMISSTSDMSVMRYHRKLKCFHCSPKIIYCV